MILVLDKNSEGLDKSWNRHDFPKSEGICVLEYFPGGMKSNFRRISQIIKMLPEANTLVIFGLRVIDIFVLSRIHKDTKVVLIQHGIFIPLFKRKIGSITRKIDELIAYIYLLIKMGSFDVPNLAWILGYNEFKNTSLFNLVQRVDTALVYSRYWEDYFRNNFGIKGSIVHTGNSDMALFSGKIVKVEGLVYVAQSLVEDARLNLKLWHKFIKHLGEYMLRNGIYVIHVKLHPRTDRSLFARLDPRIRIEFYHDLFPLSYHVIGHYSTLLGLYALLGSECCIYEFKGHPTPNFFPGNRTFDLQSFMEHELTESPEYLFGAQQNTFKEKVFEVIFEKL